MLTIQSQLNGGMHATKSKAITNILQTMKFENETPITTQGPLINPQRQFCVNIQTHI